MMNLLTRRFSGREKFLLLVLAVVLIIGLYVLGVHYPVKTSIETARLEAAEVDDEILVAEARAQVYQNMKAELDEIFAMPPEEVSVLPAYDNIQSLMLVFNNIFAGTDPALSFDAVQFNGSIATRTVRFSFTAGSYTHAREVLTALTGTGYRSLMDSVAFAPLDSDVENGALRVTGSITFYELNETPAEPALSAGPAA